MARDRDDYSDRPGDRYDDRYGDDRPRRRDDRDDDYDDVPRRRELSGLDAMFANTSMPILILFPLCCNGIALILGIIGWATCKDETAKSNARMVAIIGGIVTVLGCLLNLGRIAAEIK